MDTFEVTQRSQNVQITFHKLLLDMCDVLCLHLGNYYIHLVYGRNHSLGEHVLDVMTFGSHNTSDFTPHTIAYLVVPIHLCSEMSYD